MTFLERLQTSNFWKNVLKVSIPFFIIVTIFSLFINSFSAIFSGDFDTVYQTNFANNKWQSFWGYKMLFSILYGMYMTNKSTK